MIFSWDEVKDNSAKIIFKKENKSGILDVLNLPILSRTTPMLTYTVKRERYLYLRTNTPAAPAPGL
jgi:hypothetical protein